MAPGTKALSKTLPPFTTKDVLIVVDMQQDFIDGILGTPEAQEIRQPIQHRIQQFLEVNPLTSAATLIFTLDTHGPDYKTTLEGKNLPVPHCIKNTPGWSSVYPKDLAKAVAIEKETFGSSQLGLYLQELQAKHLLDAHSTVELVGVCTDICVIANAIVAKTFLPQIPIRVISTLCAGTTVANHEQALKAMEPLQIEVI